MKKETFVNRLKQMKFVAHRLGYQMTRYPENSLEVLKTIFESPELLNSCYGFEFDICFTKDNVPVVIHDSYIDDVSDSRGSVANYTLKDLRKLTFKFRKSLKVDNNSVSYKIITLEEILSFFEENISLLKDKIIKIETKDYVLTNKNNLNMKNLTALAGIINKFPTLSKNIVHLSFWPLNLLYLKKIQKKNRYQITKCDLLCDYSFVVFLTKFMPFLDSISLRIKTDQLSQMHSSNTKRVNKKIKSNVFWINFANALKEKNLNYAVNKYGSVGLYTLNDREEIDVICKHMSDDFFKENYQKIVITTNNPILFKTMNINN